MINLCLIILVLVAALCDSLCLPNHVHKKISDVGKFRRYAGKNEDAVRHMMARADAQPLLDFRRAAGKSVRYASLNERVPMGSGFTNIQNFIGKKTPSTFLEDPKLVPMKNNLVDGNYPDAKLSRIIQPLVTTRYNESKINLTDGRQPYPESTNVNWHFNDLMDRSYLSRPQLQEQRIFQNGTRDNSEGIMRFEQNGPSADRGDRISNSTKDEPGFSSDPSSMSAGVNRSNGNIPLEVLKQIPQESSADRNPYNSAFLTSKPHSTTANSVESDRRLFNVIQNQNQLDLLNIPLLLNTFKIGMGDLKDAISRQEVPKKPLDNARHATRSCHPPVVTTQCTSAVGNFGADSLAKMWLERIRPGMSVLIDGSRKLPPTNFREGSIPTFLSPSILDTPVLMIPLSNFHIESVVARPDNLFLPPKNGSESLLEDLHRYMNYQMYLKLLNRKELYDLTTKVDSIDLPNANWSEVLTGDTKNNNLITAKKYLHIDGQPSHKVSSVSGKQDTYSDNLSRLAIGNRFSSEEKNRMHKAMKSERFGSDSIFPLLKVAANLAISKYSNKPKIEPKLENSDEFNFKENFTRYRPEVDRRKPFEDPISTRNYSEELIRTTPVSVLQNATLEQEPSKKTFEYSTRNDCVGSFSESVTERCSDGAKATSFSYSTALEGVANQFIFKTLHNFENSFKSPANQTEFNKTKPFYLSSANRSDHDERFHLDPNRFKPLQVSISEPWKRNGSNISDLLGSNLMNVFNGVEKLPETNLSSSSDDRASCAYAMKAPQYLRSEIISDCDKFFPDFFWDDLSQKLGLLRDSSSYSNEDKLSHIGGVVADSAFKEKDIARESVASNVPVHPTPELNVPYEKIFDNEAGLIRFDDINKDTMDKVSGAHLYHCPRTSGNRRNADTLCRLYDKKHFLQATPIKKEALEDILNRNDKCIVSNKKCGYYSSNKSGQGVERMTFLRNKTGAIKIPAVVVQLANDAKATTRSCVVNRENDDRQVIGMQLPNSNSMMTSVSQMVKKKASTEQSPRKNLLQPPIQPFQKTHTNDVIQIVTEKTAVEKVVVKGDGVNQAVTTRGLGNTATKSEIIPVASRRLAEQSIKECGEQPVTAAEEKPLTHIHQNTITKNFTDHRPLYIFALDSNSFEKATRSKPKLVINEIPVNLIIKHNGTDKTVPQDGEPMPRRDPSIAECCCGCCPTCKPTCGPTCRQVSVYPIYPLYPIYPIQPILSVDTSPSSCEQKYIVIS